MARRNTFTTTLCAFLLVATSSLMMVTVDAKASHKDHISGSGYKILLAGYNATVAPYTFTPPAKLEASGPVINGTLGTNPSWLSFSQDHPLVYSTDEATGQVFAVRASVKHSHAQDELRARTANADTGLEPIGKASTGGQGPVASVPVGKLLFVANYNSGSASVHQLKADGTFASQDPEQVWQFQRDPAGSIGPIASRQDHSYAHQVAVDPSSKWVYVPDLGADKIHRLSVPSSGKAKDVELVGADDVAEGSGPRHIAFYQATKHSRTTHAYLASELATTLTAFDVSPQDGSLKIIGGPQSALPQGVSPGGNSTAGHVRTTSEVAVSPDGRFVYVGTRHDDVEDHVAIFKRNENDGSVAFQEWVGSGGRNLRHFSLSPDAQARFLIAGNQDTSNVTILARDVATGSLSKTPATLQNIGQVAFAGFVTGPSARD